jgi:pimeloyl-ACP methyl ester carboxylesterase
MIALALASASVASPSPAAPALFLDVEGGRIAYDVTGTGPVVIAVPGLGDLRSEYRFLRATLAARGFRVVTLDLRGHGDSSTGFTDHSAEAIGRDVLALAQRVAPGERVTLIGTSMGAAAVSFAAATAPDVVERVVLIGPFVREVPRGLFMKLAVPLMFGGAAPWRVGAWLSYVDTLYPTKKPADWDEVRRALADNFAVRGRFDAVYAMLQSDRVVVDGLLSAVQAPVLVVMGSKDPDFKDPRVEADLVAARMSGAAHARVAMIAGAGHYPHAELPELTLPVIEAFLRSTDGAR